MRNSSLSAKLAGLGGVLLLRLFLEPIVFPYYVAPGAVVVGFACMYYARRLPLELMWWQFVLTLWALQVSQRTGWWWCGTLVILLAAARAGWRFVQHSPAASAEAKVAVGSGTPVKSLLSLHYS